MEIILLYKKENKMVWRELENAYNLLEDELSKRIFELKSKWYFQGGEDETIDYLYNYYE